MPDRDAPGPEPVRGPAATRLEEVERLRRQLEHGEPAGGPDDDSDDGGAESMRGTRRPPRRKRSSSSGVEPRGVWRSDGGPVTAAEAGPADRSAPDEAPHGESHRLRARVVSEDLSLGGETDRARNECLRLMLTARMRERAELSESLLAAGFAAEAVRHALEEVAATGLIGDDDTDHVGGNQVGDGAWASERSTTLRSTGDSRGRTRRGGRRRGGSSAGGQGGAAEAARREADRAAGAVGPDGGDGGDTAGGGTEAQAKDVCLRLLTDRARSRAELADKLAAKGFAPEVAARALDRLAHVGLVDDAAFAEQWVRSRHVFSGKGTRAIAQELRRKGVAPVDAEPALAAVTAEDEHARAAELVRRKRASLPADVVRDKAVRRLVGMLARRGYSQSTAYAVVTEELSGVGRPHDHAVVDGNAGTGAYGSDDDQRSDGGMGRAERGVAAPEVDGEAEGDAGESGDGGEGTDEQGSTGGHGRAVEQDEAHEGVDEYDSATALVRRKLRTLPPNLDPDKAFRRMVGMLARRGYRQGTAYAVVRDEWAARSGE